MGVHHDATRHKFAVRWTESGRRRIKRFDTEPRALTFYEQVSARPGDRRTQTNEKAGWLSPRRGDGIYARRSRGGHPPRSISRPRRGRASSGEPPASKLTVRRAGGG